MTNRLQGTIGERSALRHREIEQVAIGHAFVDNCSALQACEIIVAHAKAKGRPAFVATANAHHIVLLDKDPRFREIYRQADLVVADGMSLLFASRLYRRSLQQRVTGVDMFSTLCGVAAQEGLRVFLLGGLPGSAELAGAKLKAHFPNLNLSTFCPAVGFEQSADGLQAAADAILAAQPDLLFVALGAPKQEYWIHEHGLGLSVPISIGVGGSFEMVAGILPRAPEWIQRLGFEWFHRLCLEPRRMWRRYLIGNVEFAAMIMRQYFRQALGEEHPMLESSASPSAKVRSVETIAASPSQLSAAHALGNAGELNPPTSSGAAFSPAQAFPLT